MRKRALTLLAVVWCLAAAPSTRADDESRAVIEKAVRAHGGEDKLAKLRVLQMKSKGTVVVNGSTAMFTADSCRQLPDRSKVNMQLEIGDVKLQLVQVQNGKLAWSRLEDQTEELQDERLAEQQARTHQLQVQSLLPLLKDKAYNLSLLGEIKVNDRPAVGVRAAFKGQADINLYFDKEHGLLLKCERRGLSLAQQEISLETFFGEYKEIDGLKQPMKLLIHQDGKLYMEMQVTELRFEESIDASEFARP